MSSGDGPGSCRYPSSLDAPDHVARTELIENSKLLFLSADFGRQNIRIFGSSITECSQQGCMGKAGVSKFGKEGAAFPSATDSGKPVARLRSYFRGQRAREYQFCREHNAAMPSDPTKFLEDQMPCRI